MVNAGIDYGMGLSNIDKETGIRFGVISQHSVSGDALNDLEPDYGDPHCPKCGNLVDDLSADPSVRTEDGAKPDDSDEYEQYTKHGCADFACATCKITLDSSDCYPDEAQGFTYDQDGYKLTQCLDSDIFVLKSNYCTFAQFCSPCVPGAGNLDNFMADGVKTYCLGHDWFEGGVAPYPVFDVKTSQLFAAVIL